MVKAALESYQPSWIESELYLIELKGSWKEGSNELDFTVSCIIINYINSTNNSLANICPHKLKKKHSHAASPTVNILL